MLKMTPLESGPWPYQLWMWVDLGTGLPVRTEMDSQSVRMETVIKKTVVNAVWKDALFKFEPPPDAEIIKASGGQR